MSSKKESKTYLSPYQRVVQPDLKWKQIETSTENPHHFYCTFGLFDEKKNGAIFLIINFSRNKTQNDTNEQKFQSNAEF